MGEKSLLLFYHMQPMDALKDKGIEITVSIGLACYPNCTNDIHSLVDIADIRMYRGKEMGGDQVIA